MILIRHIPGTDVEKEALLELRKSALSSRCRCRTHHASDRSDGHVCGVVSGGRVVCREEEVVGEGASLSEHCGWRRLRSGTGNRIWRHVRAGAYSWQLGGLTTARAYGQLVTWIKLWDFHVGAPPHPASVPSSSPRHWGTWEGAAERTILPPPVLVSRCVLPDPPSR